MSIFPHFRMYKKSNHPALILDNAKKQKEDDSFLYRKASHSRKVASKGYEKVYPNPNKKDKRAMYIENKKRVDYKNKFGPILPWQYLQKNKQEAPRDPQNK